MTTTTGLVRVDRFWLITEISIPHFLRHKARTFLTLIGISSGVSAVVATTMLNGAMFQSFERLVFATAGDAQLHVENGGVGVPEDTVEMILDDPNVEFAAPVVEGALTLVSDNSRLSLFGIDVLADNRWRKHLPRSAVYVPDEHAFLVQQDSVVLVRSYAMKYSLELGSELAVMTPLGRRDLVVRGFVADSPLARLFGGAVAVMDLPAAQMTLGKVDRVDRVDVHLKSGTDAPKAASLLELRLGGRARVEEAHLYGRKVKDLLFTLRVMLTQAGAVSLIVGFLIIYHTMAVSIAQRHEEIRLLRSLGVSRRAVLTWLFGESALLGTAGALLGSISGIVLGKIAGRSFGLVTDPWIHLPSAAPAIASSHLLLALAIGIGVAFVAVAISSRTATLKGGRAAVAAVSPDGIAPKRLLLAAVLGIGLVAALVATVPRPRSFAVLVVYLNSLVIIIFACFGLAAVLPCAWIARLGTAVGERTRGLRLLLASTFVGSRPTAPIAVVVAIVIALGWTLSNMSLVASVKKTWLSLVDDVYEGYDILVTREGSAASLVTGDTFPEELLTKLQRIAGVASVEGMRQLEAQLAGKPVVIEGIDRSAKSLSLIEPSWTTIAAAFWGGQGVLLSDNLARLIDAGPQDDIALNTPSGEQRFRVLGVFRDLAAGDLGSVAFSRSRFREIWNDRFITRAHIVVAKGVAPVSVQEAINHQFSADYGIHAVTFDEFRGLFVQMLDGAFAGTSALMLVSFTVSLIALVNFLLSAVIERRVWYRVLHGVGVDLRTMQLSFVVEAGLLGATGAAVGLVAAFVTAGLIVMYNIPMVNGWAFDFVFPFAPALGIALGAVLLSAAAGYLPGRVLRSSTSVSEATHR